MSVNAKAHFLRTTTATKVTIRSAAQQLNFDCGAGGVSIGGVTEEPPQQVVGEFKEDHRKTNNGRQTDYSE
jgi:hypothetical protein